MGKRIRGSLEAEQIKEWWNFKESHPQPVCNSPWYKWIWHVAKIEEEQVSKYWREEYQEEEKGKDSDLRDSKPRVMIYGEEKQYDDDKKKWSRIWNKP